MEEDLKNLAVRKEKTQGIHLKYIDEQIANPTIDFGPTVLTIFARSHPIHELRKEEILEVARTTRFSETLGLPDDIFDNLVVGVYEHSNGNVDQFSARLNQLKEQTEGPYSTFARLIYYQLEGMTAYNEGNFEKTLAYFDSAIFATPEIEWEGPYQGFIHMNNLIKGEILFQSEKFQGAKPYFLMNYRNSDMSFNYQDWNHGLCIYRLAQIHQALNEEEDAIAYYNLLLDLYQNSDPVYAPWKEDAERQLLVIGTDLENRLQESDADL